MERSGNRATIELVLRRPDGAERDVAMTFSPETLVAEAAAALAAHAGVPDATELFVARQRRRLEPDAPMAEAELLRGDVLCLSEPGAPRGGPVEAPDDDVLELVAVGGPSMGSRWPLPPHGCVIGRSRDCDITVEDPAMSRAHLQIEIDGSSVRLTDRNSTNGTFIDGVRISDGHLLGANDVVEAGASLLKVERAEPRAGTRAPVADGWIRFNRPPRLRPGAVDTALVIPAPPAAAEKPRLPLVAAGIPLVIALVLWQLFPDNPGLLVIMALSPAMAVASYVEERRRGSRHRGRDESAWRRRVDDVIATLEEARVEAARRLRASAPDASDLERRAHHVEPSLWERRPRDDDFMLLRTGWGDRSWSPDLQREPGGSDALRREVEERLTPALVLPSVPLTLSLRSPTVTGLCGDRPAVDALTRWWLVQIATLHSPEDVSVVGLFADDESAAWSWTGWLPHTRAAPGSPAAGLQEVLGVIERRRSAGARVSTELTQMVVIVRGGVDVPASSLARLLQEGPAAGVSVVWLGAHPEDLPGECSSIVEVTSLSGDVSSTFTDGTRGQTGAAEGLDEATARGIALAVAPIREVRAAEARRTLADQVSLFDVLGVAEPSEGWVTGRWAAADHDLRAPIGLGHDATATLDLLHDGPHALVAGTTGAGKSELLQTWVAALAATYPPDRLNLLLIDYKGGAAFKDLHRLPHAVGFVTDLDGHLAERALVSLNAELKGRERALRAVAARDVAELEHQRAPGTPPRLVLVIDEFATLVKELPSFVDGVVDLAQRGRSLGIHLLLATQRPAGVITDAVRANTNLRIALRVADEADSHDVIGAADAAHIPRRVPGRTYVRRGHGELEEIQTAFGGVPVTRAARGVEVRDLWSEPSRSRDAATSTSQLQLLVRAIADAAEEANLPRPQSPWLPPLPAPIPLAHLRPQENLAVVGLLDEPQLQRQRPALLTLDDDGGCIVFGAAGSGKTSLLLTIGASFASSKMADATHLYGLDCGGGGLRPLEAVPQCGDVVTGDDQERVERLFFMIRSEIQRRRAMFAESRVTGIDGFVRARGETVPRLLILVDDYGAFASAFERVNLGELIDLLPQLVSEGRAAGVHFFISATRRASVPAALAAAVGKKIVLRLGDADDYAALGLDRRSWRNFEWGPGRGFIDGIEFQAATVGSDPAPEAVERALKAIAAEPAQRLPRPPAVTLLPRSLPIADLPPAPEPWVATVGVRETDLSAAHVDVTHGHVVVAGPYRSGRSTALATIATSLRASTEDIDLLLLAPRRTPLLQLDLWDEVAQGTERCEEVVNELAEARPAVARRGLVVIVDDAEELADGAVAYSLEPLVKKARDTNRRFAIAAESRSLHRAFGGWLTEVRKDKHGVLLDPEVDLDGDLFGVKLPRRQNRSFPPGRGYLVSRRGLELVQIATPLGDV